MDKVKCEKCGKQVPFSKSIQIFELAGSNAETLCMDCYYKELTEMQERRKNRNDNHSTQES